MPHNSSNIRKYLGKYAVLTLSRLSSMALIILILSAAETCSADAVVTAGQTSASQTFRPGQSFRDCSDCPVMVVVPPGSYEMGSSGPRYLSGSEEHPQHKVNIDYQLAVGRHPVKLSEFSKFVESTGYFADGDCITNHGHDASWQSPGFNQKNIDPVVCVSWNDAKSYAKWLSKISGHEYRLLSEAEFEYVLRAGSGATYPWGERLAEACLYGNAFDNTANGEPVNSEGFPCTDGYTYTSPVGHFKENAFGLFDTFGNVSQWVEDCFHNNYINAPVNGGAWLESNNGNCKFRIARGGAWDLYPPDARSARRLGATIGTRTDSIGFRVAREL